MDHVDPLLEPLSGLTNLTSLQVKPFRSYRSGSANCMPIYV
jgi:hypothetical protein